MKKRFLLTIAALLYAGFASFSLNALGQNGDVPTTQEPVLANRDFPFLMDLLQAGPVHDAFVRDADLKRMTDTRWAAAEAATANCGASAACEGKALLFTPEEINEVGIALRKIYERNAAVRAFAEKELKPIDEFSLNPSLHGVDLLLDNWTRSATGINLIIERYCEGQKPRYSVDTALYPEDSLSYSRLVQILLEDLHVTVPGWPGGRNQASLFFEPSLRFSLRLLQANSLDQAGRFWPLHSGPNATAIQQLKTIHWNKYPYSVIVVPGAGSELPNVALSPWGKERLRLAADAYGSGAAPLLIVTGGFVHPPHTQFCEAIEMKRYLEHSLGIPASAILVEPYARHTTTNLRNAVREILDYGLPTSRPMLIVSDADQIDYIQSQTFATRCQHELGYLPVTLGKRLSRTQLTATLSKKSLFRDPQDPLDP